MEKIGLVTITYNSADVIRDFLDSTLSQTFQNFVIYIIDNNSQDDTLEILKENTDSRIKLVQNKKNFGVARANNQGIELALKDNCTQVLILCHFINVLVVIIKRVNITLIVLKALLRYFYLRE